MEPPGYDLLPDRAGTGPAPTSAEEADYQDEGCELFPACLRCPLPACRYDEPGRLQREARRERDQALLHLVRERGRSPGELAAACGLSVRTVYRILRRHGTPSPARHPTDQTYPTDRTA
ncbi:MAG: sigma-70 family RNA polymerase sigma factor [Chloroflexi bacterium]|nr:sigma-70 family RNA polymerase sigma factor [Chloroflexota bacterium]